MTGVFNVKEPSLNASDGLAIEGHRNCSGESQIAAGMNSRELLDQATLLFARI